MSATHQSDPGPSSRVARAAIALAAASVSTAALGVLGAWLGILPPMAGFGLFVMGALLGGVLSMVTGGVAVFLTNGGRDPQGFKRAWGASIGGVAMLLGVVLASAPGDGLPPINDISTDLVSPPAFAADPAGAGRDMSYPADFVPQVQAAYPDLSPIRLSLSQQEAYAAAVAAARRLGWTITQEDPAAGVFEAREETAVFRFVDDVSVRVAENDGTVVVDVRSKSRDGRGDLGANATRIRAFGAELVPGNVATR
jgi:uncharacterized protein (DUF1499 family)